MLSAAAARIGLGDRQPYSRQLRGVGRLRRADEHAAKRVGHGLAP